MRAAAGAEGLYCIILHCTASASACLGASSLPTCHRPCLDTSSWPPPPCGPCREEYLAESAARLAMSAGELREAEQHALRAKAPLQQHARGTQADGAPPGLGEVEQPALLPAPCLHACATAPHYSSCLTTIHAPSHPPTELLEGWYMRAVALFAEHGHGPHSQRACALHWHVLALLLGTGRPAAAAAWPACWRALHAAPPLARTASRMHRLPAGTACRRGGRHDQRGTEGRDNLPALRVAGKPGKGLRDAVCAF